MVVMTTYFHSGIGYIIPGEIKIFKSLQHPEKEKYCKISLNDKKIR